ncbi:MAG: DNA recombination protein RmuC [Muribaculaceae bacterium]
MLTPIIILSLLLAVASVALAVCLSHSIKSDRKSQQLSINNEQLQLLNSNLQTENTSLRKDAEQLKIDGATLNEKINSLNTKISELSDTVADLTKKRAEQAETIIVMEAQKSELRAKLNNAENLIEQSKQRQAEINKQSEETFKNIANEILKQNSRDFKEANETRINEILKPFKENVEHMQHAIKEYYENGIKETSSLKTTIDELTKLNNQLGKEANELSAALRGNKNNTQGPWGEMILRQILEGSGLIEGVNFRLQATENADGSKIEGNYRPDALLFLPDNKVLVVDSKVNITSYIEYANATNDDDRKRLLCEHVKAVETQISSLSSKNYYTAVKGSADFVIMFMPNEGAYIAAMHGDPELWNKAYNKHVLLVSPTHLISVVKMMEQLWKNDKQNRNAIEIAEESGKLIDKLAGFVDDMSEIGNNLNKATGCYEKAMNKLRDGRGNILSRADKITKLGAKATKQLPSHNDDNE